MIKDRLRELNIKLTELSDYVKLSRPTLYKYIESYEKGDFGNVRSDVLNLFRYIEKPETKREQAIAYMITTSGIESSDDRDTIRKYLLDPESSQSKIEFIRKFIETDVMDNLIPYLSNCMEILSHGKVNEDNIHQVARFVILKSEVTKNVQLEEEELENAKNILGKSYEQN